MKKRKKISGMFVSALCILGMVLCLTGCEGAGKREPVVLTVWGSEESQDMLRQMADAFIEEYKKEADIEINLGISDESTLADNVINSPERAADVFSFPDDQFSRLMSEKLLLPVTSDAEGVIEANGGREVAAVECAMADGQLYAYPMTASNGYFMYYNAAYFTEDDVKTLDKMLEIAGQNGKYVSMDWSSGWYIYSFFDGAGLALTTADDGMTNICNWNATDTAYKGVEVAQAMLDISAKKGFYDCNDDSLKAGISDGSIIAGVNGQWNASFIEEVWGDDYRAVKLPTYTLNGEQVQMGSFTGFKLVGVNAMTKQPEWAMRFADWMTNYENQLFRFRTTGECPSNIEAAKSEEVQASQAVKALSDQAPFSSQQKVGGNFWTPATLFGTVMSSGNLDDRDLQELLDELVSETEKPAVE